MSVPIQRLTIPVFVRGLSVLDGYLANAAAKDRSGLVDARLAPDMLTFTGQIQRASDTSKGTVARVTGTEAPSFPDTEKTLDELRARVARTIDYLRSVPASAFAGADQRIVTIKLGGRSLSLGGCDYLLQFGLPNFYFHVATAHAILRREGIPVGKIDYLGPFDEAI
ncbi:MAG: DUF1993 family protein [Lautropia sp.]